MANAADRELAAHVGPAAAGDDIAFARIVSAYHDDMLRVCGFVAGDPSLAEEAVQTAWSVAWRKLVSLREPDRLRPWLMRIAVNETKRLLKKRDRRSQVEIVADASYLPGGTDPATTIDALDAYAAMGRLDPEDRALLAMRYVLGYDATELSTALGITPSGTRNRLERLLTRLRKDIDRG